MMHLDKSVNVQAGFAMASISYGSLAVSVLMMVKVGKLTAQKRRYTAALSAGLTVFY